MKANIEIRNECRKSGLFLWQLCEPLNISEPTITRWLRHELPPEKKAQILTIIKTLKEGKNDGITPHQDSAGSD